MLAAPGNRTPRRETLMKSIAKEISAKLLPRIRQPGQYVGLEVNRLCADAPAAGARFALCFPDTYAVGISHLGTRILYHALNDMPGVAADRAYTPLPDAEAVMREHGVPLFGWESRCPLRQFDVLGFSLPYELCVTNVLTMLDLAGVPLRAADRREGHPIVIAGDALADSPEPMAAFIDVFLAGDGERPVKQLAELLLRAKPAGAAREEVLLEAARTIDGAYVPRFHEERRAADGSYAGVQPLRSDVPPAIRRACLTELESFPLVRRPLVPLAEGVHDRVTLEVMRGCPNACRFCQAGAVRLPLRWRSVEEIVSAAKQAVAATGYDEISLLSLSTSDYPHLSELIDRLNAEFASRHVSISLPSLRVDSQLQHLPKLTSKVRKGGLTIAAEAGSERLRKAIGKRITEADMLAGVRAAYEAGWRKVKVYFMAGLPGETEQDIEAIFHLCKRLSDAGKPVSGHPGSINASVSWFVPKPHTPMQWSAMRDAEYFFRVRHTLRDLAQRSAVSFKFHWIERSVLEGVLARGDRRMADVIEAAWRAGARLDSWDEHFDWNLWQAAFAEAGIDPSAIGERDIPVDEPLPWGHILCHRGREFLLAERNRMLDALAENHGRHDL